MPTKPGGATPPSIEKRLPLALALMMLVLLVSQYIFKPVPGPKPVAPVNNKAAAKLAEKPAVATTLPAAPVTSVAGQVQAPSEVANTIDTNLYHIVFTNRGAAITSWVLKKYQDNEGKPLQLINSAAKDVPPPFTIEVLDRKLDFDPNTVLYQPKLLANGAGIQYEFSDGRTTVRKSFQFTNDSYQSTVESQVLQNNTPVPHLLMWRGGFGDHTVHAAPATEHTVYYDAVAAKLRTDTSKDAKNGPVTNTGDYTFGGLEDNFFAGVALPANSGPLTIRTYSDQITLPKEDKPTPFIGAGISTGAQNEFSLFVGPKDIDILKKVNPKLGQLVDWGFFGIIAKPLFLWLNWTHDHWTNNYGWAIVIVTLIINIALFPFRLTSLKSARRMQKLQPQIQAINARYKNVGLRDPKKAEQNQEIMELYKREGVNPMGGCLPMLVQLPFLYAFYRVLSIAIELRHAPWLWVKDLSAPEALPIHILPIILVVTQFATQKLTPAAGVDPNQQRMMMFMPLFFGFMFYYLSSGLVLYYLTGNLIGIAQQLIINRFMPTPVPPAPPPSPTKAPVKRTVKK
jgi:YidC/Oxa1 family membrane protein insertase